MLDTRADPQNLPDGLTERWPGAGYSNTSIDYGGAYSERAEIYDLVRDAGITGFAIVSGDRHSFWAGYAAKSLPPKAFEPVGVAFITGSISSPGQVEALENGFPRDHVLRPLFMADRPGGERPQAAVNMLLRHGVRSCLEYARSGDLAAARAVSNPDLSPHLEFVDMGGHGYATVRLSSGEIATEFVCIPRPSSAATGRTAARCAIASAQRRPVARGRAAAARATRRRGRSRSFDLADNAAPPKLGDPRRDRSRARRAARPYRPAWGGARRWPWPSSGAPGRAG